MRTRPNVPVPTVVDRAKSDNVNLIRSLLTSPWGDTPLLAEPALGVPADAVPSAALPAPSSVPTVSLWLEDDTEALDPELACDAPVRVTVPGSALPPTFPRNNP